MKPVRQVTFTGSRIDVLNKSSEWKSAHRHIRIIGDCAPSAVTDIMDGPERAPADRQIWSGTILYEDSATN